MPRRKEPDLVLAVDFGGSSTKAFYGLPTGQMASVVMAPEVVAVPESAITSYEKSKLGTGLPEGAGIMATYRQRAGEQIYRQRVVFFMLGYRNTSALVSDRGTVRGAATVSDLGMVRMLERVRERTSGLDARRLLEAIVRAGDEVEPEALWSVCRARDADERSIEAAQREFHGGIIDGEKGGVGKSLFARLFLHFWLTVLKNEQSPVLFDTDASRKDVESFYFRAVECGNAYDISLPMHPNFGIQISC